MLAALVVYAQTGCSEPKGKVFFLVINMSVETDANPFEIFSNTGNTTSLPPPCTFNGTANLTDFVILLQNPECFRHSFGFTLILLMANFLVLLFGFLGNCMVIYVVTCKIKSKTASSIFILNLAVADMLVILCCVPTTLVANLLIRKMKIVNLQQS